MLYEAAREEVPLQEGSANAGKRKAESRVGECFFLRRKLLFIHKLYRAVAQRCVARKRWRLNSMRATARAAH